MNPARPETQNASEETYLGADLNEAQRRLFEIVTEESDSFAPHEVSTLADQLSSDELEQLRQTVKEHFDLQVEEVMLIAMNWNDHVASQGAAKLNVVSTMFVD